MTALGSGWGKLQDELRRLGEDAERLRREHIIVKNERNEARQLSDRLALALIAHHAVAGSTLGGCGAYRDWLYRSWADESST